MISVIVTSAYESKTIGRCLKYIVNNKYSGYRGMLEVIQVSPDDETLNAGLSYVKSVQSKFKNLKFLQIKDRGRGKVEGLNQALDRCKGQIVVLTDGDVYFSKFSLVDLIKGFESLDVDIACGAVESQNSRNTFWGYISHMMVWSANNIRLQGLKSDIGMNNSSDTYFPLSGYILIMNKEKFEKKTGLELSVPLGCLVDDAYLSMLFHENHLKLGFVSKSKVKVKFPTSFSDFVKQKKRSTGGNILLGGYFKSNVESKRNIFDDLQQFLIPIKFAKTKKELLWSLTYYPIRLYMWVLIYIDLKLMRKESDVVWQRVESAR